jgi:elongation factor G
MRGELLEYYQSELSALRTLATAFAHDHPDIAKRLQLDSKQSTDPHVERLLQGFAFLAARVQLKLEPQTQSDAVVVKNEVKPGAHSSEMLTLIEQEVRDSAQGAGMLGYPLIQVRFTILSIEATELENPEVAFRRAAADAVHRGVNDAGVVLLEPIMKLEVVTPDEFMGNVHADLMSRRAVIVGTDQRGDLQVIAAEVPLATMFGYSTHVRSLSQGRASYSMEPLKYAVAPPEVLKEMMGQ